MTAFFTGFLLSFSLILAIGAQNAFVFRMGLLRKHVLSVVLFCAFSDALLIGIGIAGIHSAKKTIESFFDQYQAIIFGLAAIWLVIYAMSHFIKAIRNQYTQEEDQLTKVQSKKENSHTKSRLKTLAICALLTFGNPHVYLDTIVLIGSVSLQFVADLKIFFTLGAISASFIFFFSLGFGARFFLPLMKKPHAWRRLDIGLGFLMLFLAYKIAQFGSDSALLSKFF